MQHSVISGKKVAQEPRAYLKESKGGSRLSVDVLRFDGS